MSKRKIHIYAYIILIYYTILKYTNILTILYIYIKNSLTHMQSQE